MSKQSGNEGNHCLSSFLIGLIQKKSKKDNIEFNASQLAEAIQVPRSVITRLIQPDLNKRVFNPRVDTLIKIVTYFKSEGINISLDELVGMK